MSTAEKVAPAFQKLTRKSAPITTKILRHPFQLSQARAELERFKKAKRARLESSLMALFRRKGQEDLPIKVQIQVLEARVQKLENDFLDGVLTPLTEAEVWEVRAEYHAIMSTLNDKALQYEGAAREAFKAELIQISAQLWASKWVELALKKPGGEAGKWERFFAPGEASSVEPTALLYLFNQYHQAFSLTDEELGKFAAPTNQAN